MGGADVAVAVVVVVVVVAAAAVVVVAVTAAVEAAGVLAASELMSEAIAAMHVAERTKTFRGRHTLMEETTLWERGAAVSKEMS